MVVDRYSRQRTLLGDAAQERLLNSCLAIVGQGALGTASSALLCRAGLGKLIIIDDDVVELGNLQRQSLFTEEDIGEKKVLAAAGRLRKINSDTEILAFDRRLDYDNAEELLSGAELVIDASDNFEARECLNLYCVERQLPWIYGGVVGTQGMMMSILPKGPCFKCLMPGPAPVRGSYPTAASEGIVSGLANILASLQCTEAIKLLTQGCDSETLRRGLLYIDLWENKFEEHEVVRLPGCPVCGRR